MKHLYSFIAVMIMALASLNVEGQQNMVPNGNFEAYTSCPSSLDQLDKCTGWNRQSSSDFYHSCSTGSVGVPANSIGRQYAASGSGYVGVITYDGTGSSSNHFFYKEYPQRSILPLKPGYRYDVSMSVSLAEGSAYTSNDLGIFFSTASVYAYGCWPISPQVSFANSGPVTDTANWVRVTNRFMADSAYGNILIGGFGCSSLTSGYAPTGRGVDYAYYYIDSIVVKPMLGLQFSDTLLCAGDTLKVPFSVDTSFSFYNADNVFTLQLSDTSGDFASAVTLDTIMSNKQGEFIYPILSTITRGNNYRIRITSSSPVDTFTVSRIAIGAVIPDKPIATANWPVCYNSTLQLSATSTTAGVRYYWEGSRDFVSTSHNPTINNITKPGQYIVSSILYGCVSKDTVDIVIDSVGINITSNAPICRDDTLKLLSIGTDTVRSCSWSGPNGFTCYAKDTLITNATLSNTGGYTVTAEIAPGCVVQNSINIFVKSKVTNHSATSNTPLCSGDTLWLTANSSNSGVTYIWSGPALFSSGAAVAERRNTVVADGGQYTVSYTSGNGCYVYDTVAVVINQSPADITASANTPLCETDTLKLNATSSSGGTVWAWNGPNIFTASSQNTYIANASLTAAGRYYVKVTATNGCFRKDSIDVLVKPQPAGFSASSNSPQCQGSTLSLSGTTTSTGVTFSWAGPGSFSSSLQNPFFSNAQPAQSGNYILTATLNGCIIKDTEVVNVIAIPATPVPTANTPVCIGQSLNLNAGSVGPSWLWSGPGGFVNTTQTPSIPNAIATTAGTYTVKAIDGGCESPTASVTVSVIPKPTVFMYPSPKDSICDGTTVTFRASASNAGTGATYKWFRNGLQEPGAFSNNYATIPLNDYDEYYCEITSNGTCAIPFSDTGNHIVMRVFPWLAPAVSIAATPTGTVKGGDLLTFNATPTNGGNYPKYQWKRNNKDVIGALSYTWGAKDLADKDVVCVVMTSDYLCPQPKTANSNCITVSINTTGIDTKQLKGFSIYPNPVTNELILEGVPINTRIQLFDVLGRMVINETSAKEKEILNTISLTKGTYLLQLTDTYGNRMNAKVVKE